MERRTFVRGALLGTGAVLGGSLWRELAAATEIRATPGVAPEGPARGTPARYRALRAADANGVRLPPGFTSRVVARSGRVVPGTSYRWHPAPDGGACFRAGTGWIYVSNSEVTARGGVGALRFDARGRVVDAYRILAGTSRNCAGGTTPWGTWLSCEEVTGGYVYETYPLGGAADVRPAMGRFKHEAAAADPVRRCIYLTEDEPDGCFYRFVPAAWPDLSRGRLDVLRGRFGPMSWARVADPLAETTPTRHQVRGAKRFRGGEGAVYAAGTVWFTTKGDNRVWALDATTDRLSLAYDRARTPTGPRGVDNITRAATGDLLVAEDGDDMEIHLISPGGAVSPFLQVVGHRGSELAGPAFSPDGSRLYFSSQRGRTGSGRNGVTYEVRGPFGS